MFSLQRMIASIRRKRRECLFTSQGKHSRIKIVEDIYLEYNPISANGRRIDRLAGIFSQTNLDAIPEGVPAYVEVNSLHDIGVNAFLVNQTIEVDQFPRYIIAIREGRKEMGWQHYSQGDLHTLVRHDESLSGITMHLISNDTALIRKLAGADFNPTCPWIVFCEPGPVMGFLPDNPDYYSYLPGNPEYHSYYRIWSQYWEALTLAEQEKFLKIKRQETVDYMPDDEWQDWVNEIRRRDPRTRMDVESRMRGKIPGSTPEN